MKREKILSFIMMFVLCTLGISGCSINNNEFNNNTNNSIADFEYPEESDFEFEVSKDEITAKKGEIVTIDCTLKNVSNENYYIEHGVETITYSYNEISEEINAIAVLDNFKSNSVISRRLNITVNESGNIQVFATIYVKPSQYSDQNKAYTFEKDILVNEVS